MMRIVDRKTFIAMPAGVVFSKYEPCVFGDLMIKGDSITQEFGDDFFYQDINAAIDCCSSEHFADLLFAAREDGASVPMTFDVQGRDGLFDKAQLFAVWEAGDVAKLLSRLVRALEDIGYGRENH